MNTKLINITGNTHWSKTLPWSEIPPLYCIIDSILILSTFTFQTSLLGVTFNFSTVEFIQLHFKIAK